MNKIIKNTTVALLLATITFSANAQDKAKTPAKNETQEIVIRKKGKDTKRMTIVVDGDNVTINGKPVEDFENADVRVFRRDRPMLTGPGSQNFEPNPPMPPLPPLAGNWSSNKAMLGIMTEKSDSGVLVKGITKQSGADKAGLMKGDIITKIDDKVVKEPKELVEEIGNHEPEDTVEVTYLRNGKEGKVSATLGESEAQAFSFNNKDLHMDFPKGFDMKDFNFNFNNKPKIGLQIQDVEEGKGVTVKDVDDESPAKKAGLKEGDLITMIDGKEIADVDEVRTKIKDLKEGDAISLTYKRDGKNQTTQVKIPKKMKVADL